MLKGVVPRWKKMLKVIGGSVQVWRVPSAANVYKSKENPGNHNNLLF
jgi:hypothetical protein